MYICRGARVARLRIEKIAKMEKSQGEFFNFCNFPILSNLSFLNLSIF